MTLHEQVDELIAAYSLGAVDQAEADLVRRHLPDCAECQDTLLRMTEVVAVLPLSLEEVRPPEGLRERVMAGALAGSTGAPPGRGPQAAPDDRATARPGKLLFLLRAPSWAPTAAAAVLLLGMLAWNISLQARHTTAPPPQTIGAALVDASNTDVGRVTYLSDRHLALVSLQALSKPAADRNYELWVIPSGGRPRAAGVFLPEPDGSKVLVVNATLAHGDKIAVTEEALGGVPQPTSAPIISGGL